MRRLRRSLVCWILPGAALAGAIWFGVGKARVSRAIERDARVVRGALLSGHFREAEEPLARWLRAAPSSAEAHAAAAQVALGAGDLAEVSDELNRARSLGYPNDELGRLHAASLSRLGRYGEAEPILVRYYMSSSRPDPTVDEALTRVYMMTQRVPLARPVIERWIRDAPKDGRPFLWLAELDRRMEANNLATIEKHYREALARDPELDQARLGLGETLRKLFRNAEAKVEYSDYLSRHEDDPVALAGAGRNAAELGDNEAAIRLLDQALQIDPEEPSALKGRAAIDIARGDFGAARRRLDQALARDPFDSEAHYNRARVRAALGDHQGARADSGAFEQLKKDQSELMRIFTLIVADPADNELRAKVAAWMFSHGRPDDGMGWAKSVLATDPNHAATNALLADFHSRRKGDTGLANFYRVRAEGARGR
jgi:Flp pilus assembly protein TadD